MGWLPTWSVDSVIHSTQVSRAAQRRAGLAVGCLWRHGSAGTDSHKPSADTHITGDSGSYRPIVFNNNIFSCTWNKTLCRDLLLLVPGQQNVNFGISCVNHWEKQEKHLQWGGRDAGLQTDRSRCWRVRQLVTRCSVLRCIPGDEQGHLLPLALHCNAVTLGHCAKIEAAAPQNLTL